MYKINSRIILTTFLMCISIQAQAAKIHSAGTLLCAKESKKCELSNAGTVKIKGKTYLLSYSDKDYDHLFLYDLDKVIGPPPNFFEKLFGTEVSFTDKLSADKIINIKGRGFAKKVESIASVSEWVILVGSHNVFIDKKTNTLMTPNLYTTAFKIDESGALKDVTPLSGPDLLPKLTAALAPFDPEEKEPSWLKIEASSIVPTQDGGHKMLLGIRAQNNGAGSPEKDVIRIIACDLNVTDNSISLGDNWEPILDMKQMPGHGISGLSYDPSTKTMQMITSFEDKDGDLDGALWRIDLADLLASKDTFKKLGGISFKHHKPEGLTVLKGDKSYLSVVVFDEDRTLPMLINGRTRELTESPFLVVDTRQ